MSGKVNNSRRHIKKNTKKTNKKMNWKVMIIFNNNWFSFFFFSSFFKYHIHSDHSKQELVKYIFRNQRIGRNILEIIWKKPKTVRIEMKKYCVEYFWKIKRAGNEWWKKLFPFLFRKIIGGSTIGWTNDIPFSIHFS
jgi:hypothetical protein